MTDNAFDANVVTAYGKLPQSMSEDMILRAVGGSQGAVQMVKSVSSLAEVPIVFGNRTELLVDGPRTFDRITEAIKGAESSIHLETYIFDDDDLGRQIKHLLIEKARSGVDVRIIYDAFGSAPTPDVFFDEMIDAGIDVAAFRPVNPLNIFTGKINNRDHRKLLVVDGEVAFTGGVNISQVYSQSSHRRLGRKLGLTGGWRDTHIKLNGPVVLLFQQLFIQSWLDLGKGFRGDLETVFPEQEIVGSELVSLVAASKKTHEERKIYDTYLGVIRDAQHEILITNAYFVPNDSLTEALIAAVARGVKVKLVLPGFSDSFLARYASRGFYGALLDGGVEIYERKHAFLHAKTAVIDGVISIVGSANLDVRSFVHNREITAVVIGEAFGEELRGLFEDDLREAERIDQDKWHRRPVGQRLKEWWAGLFRYWL